MLCPAAKSVPLLIATSRKVVVFRCIVPVQFTVSSMTSSEYSDCTITDTLEGGAVMKKDVFK